MLVRIAKNKKILLLCNGRIAIRKEPCVPHIWFYTQKGQHPHCLEFMLTNSREYTQAAILPNVSAAYRVSGKQGRFDVMLRWSSGHDPYPEIQNMTAEVFGVTIPESSYPLAPHDYRLVASVMIARNGRVTVNGVYAGIFPEFI